MTNPSREWDCGRDSHWAHPWAGLMGLPDTLDEHEAWWTSPEIEGYELFETEPVREELLTAILRIVRLLSLPPGWDSYGAKPIDRQKANAALELVRMALEAGAPIPSIVPTSDGSIQLEWHRRGVDLEVKAITGTSVEVFYEELATGETSEATIGHFKTAATLPCLS